MTKKLSSQNALSFQRNSQKYWLPDEVSIHVLITSIFQIFKFVGWLQIVYLLSHVWQVTNIINKF